jgi:hypothetical protein
MSMTYWLQFKNRTSLESLEEDLSILCQETESLDALCTQLETPIISSFIDSTDAAYNAGVFDDQLNPEDLDTDEPEYTLEQMQWFNSQTALPSFRSLRIALLENPNAMAHLNNNDRIALLEELDFIIGHLEQNPDQEFHLELLI